MRPRARFLVLALLSLCGSEARGLQTGGVAIEQGRFRLLRSTSGTKGVSEGGRYRIEDPRTLFSVPEDRQVVVFFEWQGHPGLHRCEGTWRDPTGKAVLTNETEYDARASRFGLYWTLALPENLAPGIWSLDVAIDGEPAGRHAFEITLNRGAAAASSRRVLSPDQIYRRGLASSVRVEALDAAGKSLGTGSGAFVGDGVVLTAFQALNGARAVRLVLPDGRRAESGELAAWSRKEDWALVRAPLPGAPRAEPAPPDSWRVGDRCFFLDAQPDGSRLIVEASVVGLRDGAATKRGNSIALSEFASPASVGAAVFNEYGEAVAMLGGTPAAGIEPLEAASLRLGTRGSSAIPLASILAASAHARGTTLAELERTGQFVPPVVSTKHFVSGVLGLGVERGGPVPMAVGQKQEFSRGDGEAVVFVTWNPGEKAEAAVTFRLQDADNRLLGESDPSKIRFKPGQSFVQHWKLKVGALAPGLYRVDVALGTDVVWRTFFRVTE